MVHLVGGEVLTVLHRPDPGERVFHGVLGVECSVGYFEVGVGVGCEELDEGRVGVPSPEIHRVDINVCDLVCGVTRSHVAELSVELLEALLLLLKEPNPDGSRAHCEATWGGMMKEEEKRGEVQRTGALLCLLSLVKFWVFPDIQDYVSTMPK